MKTREIGATRVHRLTLLTSDQRIDSNLAPVVA
jgi:hypothetical protein